LLSIGILADHRDEEDPYGLRPIGLPLVAGVSSSRFRNFGKGEFEFLLSFRKNRPTTANRTLAESLEIAPVKRTKFLGDLATLGALSFVTGCAASSNEMTPADPSTLYRSRHPLPSPSPSYKPSPSPSALVPSPTPTILNPTQWWGVTIDDPSNVSGLVSSLSSLPVKPIARICFDAENGPSGFTNAIAAISPVAYIMGQPFDSSDVAKTSLSTYTSMTSAYLSAFPNLTAWEVGNEVNGEWLGGTPYSGSGAATGTNNPVVAKIYAAWQLVRAAGRKTALTLYYEPSQTVTPGYDMIPWAQANIPSDMAAGLDYVLVSYYETDNNHIRPTLAQWTTIFQGLEAIFPNSYLGFGEIGMDNPATSSTLSTAESIMSYYYVLKPAVQNWIGGFFWWYFAEDCVPTSKPLWSLLDSLV
jgi:hypothetical protein